MNPSFASSADRSSCAGPFQDLLPTLLILQLQGWPVVDRQAGRQHELSPGSIPTACAADKCFATVWKGAISPDSASLDAEHHQGRVLTAQQARGSAVQPWPSVHLTETPQVGMGMHISDSFNLVAPSHHDADLLCCPNFKQILIDFTRRLPVLWLHHCEMLGNASHASFLYCFSI